MLFRSSEGLALVGQQPVPERQGTLVAGDAQEEHSPDGHPVPQDPLPTPRTTHHLPLVEVDRHGLDGDEQVGGAASLDGALLRLVDEELEVPVAGPSPVPTAPGCALSARGSPQGQGPLGSAPQD